MTLELIEGAIDALDVYMQANAAAKITALNAEYSDAITLDEIAAWFTTEQVEVERQNFPYIEILGSGIESLAENGGMLEGEHAIAIVCTVQDGADAANLRKRVYRYARAIVELCKASRASTGYALQWGSPMVDFSPAFRRRNTSKVIADCIVQVRMTKIESYP